MRTFRELKKVILGEVIAVLCILPYAIILNGDFGMSVSYIVSNYLLDLESIVQVIGLMNFAIIMTYVIYSLYRAIQRDVNEVKMYFKNKKLEKQWN